MDRARKYGTSCGYLPIPIPPTIPKGKADIVGFGDGGVLVVRNTDSSNRKPQLVITDFAYSAGGWRTEKHLRLVADVTGTGTGDIVGFGDGGVIVALNNGDGTFQKPKLVLRDFAYNAGNWRVERHPRFLCDVRKTGRADIVGFGYAGVLVAPNNGGGEFGQEYLALANFGYDSGWRVEKHDRFLADLNGDGYPDIIGFGESAVYVSINNRDGTFSKPQAVANAFCYGAGGWRVEKHVRYVADLTGDGRADIIGFGGPGVWVALNKGDGTFHPHSLALNVFAYNDGWRIEKHVRYVADLTGNGCADIIGFGDPGVYVSYNNGNGTFQPPKLVIPDFGYNSGWRVDKHPRFVADLTGDGCADIIGFGDAGILVAFKDGKGGFGPVTKIVGDLGFNAGGWRVEKHVRFPANLYPQQEPVPPVPQPQPVNPVVNPDVPPKPVDPVVPVPVNPGADVPPPPTVDPAPPVVAPTEEPVPTKPIDPVTNPDVPPQPVDPVNPGSAPTEEPLPSEGKSGNGTTSNGHGEPAPPYPVDPAVPIDPGTGVPPYPTNPVPVPVPVVPITPNGPPKPVYPTYPDIPFPTGTERDPLLPPPFDPTRPGYLPPRNNTRRRRSVCGCSCVCTRWGFGVLFVVAVVFLHYLVSHWRH